MINNGRANKSMDVRRKQLLSFLRCALKVGGLGGGFRPRHLKRYAFVGMIACLHSKEINKIEFG